MDLHRDFAEILSELSNEKVRFLVVGAYAVAFHAEPRYTKDLDLWVEPTLENAQRVWNALRRFGAPLRGIPFADFTNPQIVYQMGVEPVRIDILMQIEGCTFAGAWRRRVPITLGGVQCFALAKSDLVRSKRAVGRDQDLRDVELLTGRRRKSKRPPPGRTKR
jgi:hypothetical protein